METVEAAKLSGYPVRAFVICFASLSLDDVEAGAGESLGDLCWARLDGVWRAVGDVQLALGRDLVEATAAGITFHGYNGQTVAGIGADLGICGTQAFFDDAFQLLGFLLQDLFLFFGFGNDFFQLRDVLSKRFVRRRLGVLVERVGVIAPVIPGFGDLCRTA